jgi:hypothetical protein
LRKAGWIRRIHQDEPADHRIEFLTEVQIPEIASDERTVRQASGLSTRPRRSRHGRIAVDSHNRPVGPTISAASIATSRCRYQGPARSFLA